MWFNAQRGLIYYYVNGVHNRVYNSVVSSNYVTFVTICHKYIRDIFITCVRHGAFIKLFD